MDPELLQSLGADWIKEHYRQQGQYDRDTLSQQREIAMAGIAERASSSRQSARAGVQSARISANASLAAAKMAHKAKMFEMEKIGIPQMEINRMDVEGRLQIARMQQRLNEQALAADVVKTASEMGGPGDWVQAWNYARGISQTNIPEYLKLLASGGDTFQLGVAPGNNEVQTYGGLINQLSGGTGAGGAGGAAAGGGRDWAGINALADQIIRNPGMIALNGLENLTDDEQEGLSSIIKSRGGSAATVLDQYRRTRWGMRDNAASLAA
jgi:hypothetical protein